MAELFTSNPLRNEGYLTTGSAVAELTDTVLKFFDGSDWLEKPLKVYIEGVWVEGKLKKLS